MHILWAVLASAVLAGAGVDGELIEPSVEVGALEHKALLPGSVRVLPLTNDSASPVLLIWSPQGNAAGNDAMVGGANTGLTVGIDSEILPQADVASCADLMVHQPMLATLDPNDGSAALETAARELSGFSGTLARALWPLTDAGYQATHTTVLTYDNVVKPVGPASFTLLR